MERANDTRQLGIFRPSDNRVVPWRLEDPPAPFLDSKNPIILVNW